MLSGGLWERGYGKYAFLCLAAFGSLEMNAKMRLRSGLHPLVSPGIQGCSLSFSLNVVGNCMCWTTPASAACRKLQACIRTFISSSQAARRGERERSALRGLPALLGRRSLKPQAAATGGRPNAFRAALESAPEQQRRHEIQDGWGPNWGHICERALLGLDFTKVGIHATDFGFPSFFAVR